LLFTIRPSCSREEEIVMLRRCLDGEIQWLELTEYMEPLTQPALCGPDTLWSRPKLAFFCSAKCPGEILLRVLKWVPTLAGRNDVVLASGFHTPVEREVLRLALRQKTPVIICPARGLLKVIPAEWRGPLDAGRLLIATPFPAAATRITAARAEERNRWLADHADQILVAWATPGGRLESSLRDVPPAKRIPLV
jgi:hypothetical protein